MNIRFSTQDIASFLEGNLRFYPVLSVGRLYSVNYGILNFSEIEFEAIVANFKSGALETIPFVDIEHERGISCGEIKDVRFQDGVLFAAVEWNAKGRKLIEDGEYMYFSVDIRTHQNTRTGAKIENVLYGLALCNTPQFKEQEKIILSGEPAGREPEEDNNFQGGQNMDLAQLKAQLIEALKAAMVDESKKEEAAKVAAEMQAAIAEMLPKEPEKMAETPAPEKPEETQMSAENLQLSERVKKLEETNLKLSTEIAKSNENLKLSEKTREFDGKFGNRVPPAQRDVLFKLFLSDEKGAENLIMSMPEIIGNEIGVNSKDELTLSAEDREVIKLNGFDPDGVDENSKKFVGLYLSEKKNSKGAK